MHLTSKATHLSGFGVGILRTLTHPTFLIAQRQSKTKSKCHKAYLSQVETEHIPGHHSMPSSNSTLADLDCYLNKILAHQRSLSSYTRVSASTHHSSWPSENYNRKSTNATRRFPRVSRPLRVHTIRFNRLPIHPRKRSLRILLKGKSRSYSVIEIR